MIPPARIHVRFSDLDVLEHVNNSIYLSYFEIARVHYFAHMVGKNWDWQKDGIILVKNEVEYLKPILLHSEPYVHVFLKEIGSKSFTLSYEIRVEGVLYTRGLSKLVCYDSLKHETILIPEVMLEGLQQLKKEQ